jgi:phosphatidyl-myo-inositol dimannoside synthase
MDILVITWNYPPRRGGIENLIGSLCAELQKQHSVHVITAHTRLSMSGEENVFRAPLPGLVPFALYALWRGAVLLARNQRIDVIFGGSVLVTPLALILARLFGRRVILQAHGLDIIYRNFFYRQLCVRWLKRCDNLIANSRYTARLGQLKGVPSERIVVIPPGVEERHFSTPADGVVAKEAWGIKDRKIILFVGRLARRKGVKEFIENSFVDIVRAVPQALFLIVGGNPTESLIHRDDMISKIDRVVSKLRFKDHVRLLGSTNDDELIGLYQACELAVLPALDLEDDVEGFGIVALEAAAAGKPVVATRVGGIPDAVEDGKSGILVEPTDYGQLSQAVISLLHNHESCLSMGRFGKCRATKEFSWSRICRRYEGVFDAQRSR